MKARKAADGLVRGFNIIHIYCRNSAELNKKVRSDEFIIAYIYAVLTLQMDMLGMTDPEVVSYTLIECFGRIFPGAGRSLFLLCMTRVQEGNREFNQVFTDATRDELE